MLLIYLMEKGRSQKNSSLSQKFVHPLPQHWLIEMSAKQGNRQMTPGLSFYIWVYHYICTINETKANQSNNQMWQYWFKKKKRVCCSPQAPLVHWDVPVGPEVCDSLRVPEIKSSLRNWCQNCNMSIFLGKHSLKPMWYIICCIWKHHHFSYIWQTATTTY